MNNFLRGYIACALWSSTDEHYNNMVDAKEAGYTVHPYAEGFYYRDADNDKGAAGFQFESQAWDAAYAEAIGGSCNDTPLDNYFSASDIKGETLKKMEKDCARFMRENADNLQIYYSGIRRVDESTPEDYAGHDFWLSRNGHGSGFFDRPEHDSPEEFEDACEALQEAAREFGGMDLYVGDDGELYV